MFQPSLCCDIGARDPVTNPYVYYLCCDLFVLLSYACHCYNMSKQVIFVIGATWPIGSATVQALSAKHAGKVDIRAGVRNPDKADQLKALPGVTVVQATMGDTDNLVGTLKGVDALFIVTPGVEN